MAPREDRTVYLQGKSLALIQGGHFRAGLPLPCLLRGAQCK
jgi:hypothetical protein